MPENDAMDDHWIKEAAALPLAFAQVREDSLLDLAVVGDCSRPPRVLMVASGGCTAASLAAEGNVLSLHLVDLNPAQLELTRFKLHLLKASSPDRMELLGHAPLAVEVRAKRLRELMMELGIAPNQFGPEQLVAELGPDQVGRYERVFARLRQRLGSVADDLTELLSMRRPADQAACIAPGTALGSAVDDALSDAMSLPNLVLLFGTEATANPVQPFHRHFGGRIRHALNTLPAADNPYLLQMLLGRFPRGVTSHWLRAQTPKQMPEVTFSCGRMNDVLRGLPAESFEVVHLSNILDWLTPAAAAETLALAARALAQDGMVVIRQLNSTLDIPAHGPAFEWQADRAAELHRRDRSFFYRALHLGRRMA